MIFCFIALNQLVASAFCVAGESTQYLFESPEYAININGIYSLLGIKLIENNMAILCLVHQELFQLEC